MKLISLSILLYIVQRTLNSFIYLPTVSFPQTNVFTKTRDLNALYAVGLTDFKVYRMNYTRNLTSPTYSYSTSHKKKARAIAVSLSERYFATGSQDTTIEVVQSFTKTKLCTFSNYNQVRSIVFHPLYQQIFYSGSVNDAIRKWNITNCSQIVQNTLGGNSLHSISINPDGTFISFGTYQGYVGKIDQNLLTYVINTNQHQMTVKFMYSIYNNYYVSIGDDSKMVLWDSNNNAISSLVSLSPDKLKYCGVFDQAQFNDTHRIIGCQDSSEYCLTYLVTKSVIKRFTNHRCSQTNMNWIDFRQMAVDEQVWALHYGTSIRILKVIDNNTVLCNTNNNHTKVDAAYKTCRFCGYNFPGCHLCTISACTQCGISSYKTGSTCSSCPAGCSDCNSATSCNVCAVGYQQIGSSGNCRIAQSNPQPGCFTYSNSGSKCQIVANGYYVNSGGVCKSCNQFNEGCMQCTISTTPLCFTCQTGYYLSGTSCFLCQNTMLGCLACANSTVCLKCSVAFKLNGANLQCSNCLVSCKTCLTYYDTCTSCFNNTQNRYLSGSSCVCKDGYYDNSGSANFTCPLCSSVLTKCYLCTNNTVCIQCMTNYFLYISGSITQCQQCNNYCQTCSGTSTNCITCNSVSYNRVLAGTTCVCDTGYVSLNNSVPCLPCDKLNKGCLICTNQTYCTSCDTGYYLSTISASNKLCTLCPYYCPSCNTSLTGTAVCSNCPAGSFRTLFNGSCPCDSGYFDDNNTLVCQKCSSVLSNCLTCNNRTKCLTCDPGMFTDQSQSICATCHTNCLTCGAYFDVCASCDPTTNRVLQANKCVCQSSTYQLNYICGLCSSSIPNCNQCSNAYICTSCQAGYTLAQDLKSCIDCQGSINGCNTCTSQTNCTACKNPFTLIKNRCRCPITQYTSYNNWGQCLNYGISVLSSRLGVQLQLHQHQNNTLIVFIRFRAKTLYVINRKIQQSISLYINGIPCTFQFAYIKNNHIKLNTELNSTYQKPNITVAFAQDVFYNQNLLTLSTVNQTVQPTRLYYYQQTPITTYTSIKNVLTYIFMVFKWVFFGFTIIGQGHLLFPFVVFIQYMPLFLMLLMSLPANLSMLLDAMMSFQVKSIIPMSINSNFFVIFSPLTYDYYGLCDFLLFGKIGDILLLIFVNVMTKFDEGIVRMFAPGRIRRYLYQSLVRRGYSVMSLCILAFQPSLILLSGVYITQRQWQSNEQIFNYCCCVFTFGFYMAYIFNHASNLTGTKTMKNIENSQCFFDINSQEVTARKTTLFVLVSDFWIIGTLHLIGPMIYFTTSILLLIIRTVIHLKPGYYIGKIQFALRTFTNIFLLAIFSIMFVFYLGEKQIYIGFEAANILGLVTTVLIFTYLLFHIIEKILFTFKLQNDLLQDKVIKGQNGEQIKVADTKSIQNANQVYQAQDNQSSRSKKMEEFSKNTTGKINGFSSLNIRNNKKNNNTQKQNQNMDQQQKIGGENKQDRQQSNYPMMNTNKQNNSYVNEGDQSIKQLYTQDTKDTGDFFNNKQNSQSFKDKISRIKSVNTSKYAQNHLQLRYITQSILTKNPPPNFQE